MKTMKNKSMACCLTLSLAVVVSGCGEGTDADANDNINRKQSAVTEVAHTDVERQSIGNCWLYAAASWVESLNKTYGDLYGGGGSDQMQCSHGFCDPGEKLEGCMPVGTEHASCLAKICSEDKYCCENRWDNICVKHVQEGSKCSVDLCTNPTGGTVAFQDLDVSQSYWTYWHWFDQVTGYMWDDEISTGGSTWVSNTIIRDRGIMTEADFIPEDDNSELMSYRQEKALDTINDHLKSGELSTEAQRQDREHVRRVFDAAWGLSDKVKRHLDDVFGKDGSKTLRSGATIPEYPPEQEMPRIIDPAQLPVRYPTMKNGVLEYKDTNLVEAIREWDTIQYPRDDTDRRKQLVSVQKALHAHAPVVVTWNVDFNALENDLGSEYRGSFNMKTLKRAYEQSGPGHQGGHMTVLHDYAVELPDVTLAAGVTLEPTDPRLQQALDPNNTKIVLLRTKNSWGKNRIGRAFVEDLPGYHDLYMSYLNGPIRWCPDSKNPTMENCRSEQPGLRALLVPPGFKSGY